MENENIIEPLTVSDNTIPIYEGWNQQILDLCKLVVCDLPSDYGYVAFQDSGITYLVYGSQYSVNGNNIYFGSDVKCKYIEKLEDHFEYQTIDLSEFEKNVNSGELVYTNLLSDYPDFKSSYTDIPLIIGIGLVMGCFFMILNRNSRR